VIENSEDRCKSSGFCILLKDLIRLIVIISRILEKSI